MEQQSNSHSSRAEGRIANPDKENPWSQLNILTFGMDYFINGDTLVCS